MINNDNHRRLIALNAIKNKLKSLSPDKNIDLLTIDDLSYYSFPKIYGSTTGPFGGIGGAAMTKFQIEAYSDGITTVYFCGDKFIKCVHNTKLRIVTDI